MVANEQIREAAKISGVYLWQVADKLHIHESSLSRKLRRELPASERRRILCIIQAIAKEQHEQEGVE